MVWQRRRKTPEIAGFMDGDPHGIADHVQGVGHLALDLLDAFVGSRLELFDALVLDEQGNVAGLRPFTVPWTIWLRERDLDEDVWKLLGPGPRINWVGDDAT